MDRDLIFKHCIDDEPVTYIRRFLGHLEQLLPARRGHHSLTVAQHGSEQQEVLCLTLQYPDGMRSYFLEPGDLLPDPFDSAARVMSQLDPRGEFIGEVR